MEQRQQSLQSTAEHTPAVLTTAARQRLQKVFEHGQRCVEKKDFDYANQLFTQCVVEDPGNLIYLQHFFGNLQKKYGDNKKGARMAGLRIKSSRGSLTKAASKGHWEEAFKAGCDALSLNPWDISTLLLLANACEQLKQSECELYYLRFALGAEPVNVDVNRQAGTALQRMGQFEQAIACWQRVLKASPQDEEARKAVSNLSVEKTIQDGKYDSTILTAEKQEEAGFGSVARLSRGAVEVDEDEAKLSQEERLKAAIAEDPANIENYFLLADVYAHQQQFDDAEQTLNTALQASGGANLDVLERIEDLQIRRANQQLTLAEHQYNQDPTEQNQQLVLQLRKQTNQTELEVYATRSQRDPENTRHKYELGLRMKRAGKTKEAIPLLQAARGDIKRGAIVLLELGECFQKIEQFKLALTHYEQAIAACEEPDSELLRLALYRAGVLFTGLKELDRAEKYLSQLASLDYSYRDVANRLDKLAEMRNSG